MCDRLTNDKASSVSEQGEALQTEGGVEKCDCTMPDWDEMTKRCVNCGGVTLEEGI